MIDDVVCVLFSCCVLCGFVFDGKSAGSKLRQGLSVFFLAITSSFSIPQLSTIGINT